MTEPVAWRKKYSGDKKWRYEETGYIGDWDIVERLYTAEQLHPRVKMTQAEFDEFNSIPESASVYGAMVALYSSNIIKHVKLINRFSGNDGQINFANLWFDYRINNKSQDETIEIVPDKKLFVRSKERDDEGDYLFLSGSDLDDLDYLVFDYARAFDTQEEAEKWTNPLTEAVQLPVK